MGPRPRLLAAALAALVLVGSAIGLYLRWSARRAQEQLRAARIVAAAAASTDPLEAALLLAELRGRPEPRDAKAALDLARSVAERMIPEAVLRHPGEVLAASFSLDGRRVATGSADGGARVFPADGRGDP